MLKLNWQGQSNSLVPELVVTMRVLQQIKAEVRRFPERETAWINYGMVERGRRVPKITLLGILTKKDTAHGRAHTSIGGEDLAPKIDWLTHAFAVLRSEDKYPKEAEFLYLFKGHSHHQLRSLGQSPRDRDSTLSAVIEDGMECALAPIAVLTQTTKQVYRSRVPEDGLGRKDVSVSEEVCATVTIRFYCYSQELAAAGLSVPQILAPTITEEYNAALPMLWMYRHEEDYVAELQTLQARGFSVHAWKQDYPGGLTLYISRPEWDRIVTIHTPWDYPARFARFAISPKGHAQSPSSEDAVPFSESFAALLARITIEGRVFRGALSRTRAFGREGLRHEDPAVGGLGEPGLPDPSEPDLSV